ncbi:MULTISPECIES: SRPBCC family protein [unclassified Geodermatophilus]
MTDLTHSDSIVVAASPEEVYDLVSDVTRTGEWSPVCVACWWDEGATGQVGDWFTGRNVTPARTWETRSLVVAADRGREFAWLVGGRLVRWGYLMEPVAGGTRLTETWEFLPAGHEFFAERYGEDAQHQIEQRTRAAHEGIPATLAAVKRIAEAGRRGGDAGAPAPG